jgi:hypothetical protein
MNTVAGLKDFNPFRIDEWIFSRIEKRVTYSTENSEEPTAAIHGFNTRIIDFGEISLRLSLRSRGERPRRRRVY